MICPRERSFCLFTGLGDIYPQKQTENAHFWGTFVFEVRGVPVDVTAQNAAQARNEALALGQHKAFRRLLERLTLLKDFKKLHNLNVDELNGVAIMSDTDNSKMKTIAYYQNIFFSSE